MNNYDLAGQVAVVTGGAQGLGYAMAKRLIESGAKVSLWDRDADAVSKAQTSLGEMCSAITVDITDLPRLEAATPRSKLRSDRCRSSSIQQASPATTERLRIMIPRNGVA